MKAVLVALMALTLAAGCKAKKKGDANGTAAAPRKDLMTPAEQKRGQDACTAYVKQLCDCAATHPDLKERCDLKHAKPEALELLYGVIADPKSSEDSLLRAEVEARKLIGKCIEETAQLPSLGCL
jgi:hypothetical protein